MARGWESKNIESQQEEARSRRPAGRAPTADEQAALQRREAIELALAAKRAELANAGTDAHRAYLTRVINDLTATLNS